MRLKDIFRLGKKPRSRSKKRKSTRKKTGSVKSKKKSTITECPECGSTNIVISKMTGNTICQECGAIFAGLPPDMEKKIEEVKKQG